MDVENPHTPIFMNVSFLYAFSYLNCNGHIRQVTGDCLPLWTVLWCLRCQQSSDWEARRVMTVVSCWLEVCRGQSLSGDIHNVLSQCITVYSKEI